MQFARIHQRNEKRNGNGTPFQILHRNGKGTCSSFFFKRTGTGTTGSIFSTNGTVTKMHTSDRPNIGIGRKKYYFSAEISAKMFRYTSTDTEIVCMTEFVSLRALKWVQDGQNWIKNPFTILKAVSPKKWYFYFCSTISKKCWRWLISSCHVENFPFFTVCTSIGIGSVKCRNIGIGISAKFPFRSITIWEVENFSPLLLMVKRNISSFSNIRIASAPSKIFVFWLESSLIFQS